jgi:alpha-1,2-mannosyltransferase
MTRVARRFWSRLEAILTWKRATGYALLVGLVYVAAWAYFSLAGAAPLNRVGEPIGGDYIAFHTAGRMLLQGRGAELYDEAAVRSLEAESTQHAIAHLYDPLRNPPFFALVFAPLAIVDLVPSYVLWTACNIGFLAAAIWLALDLVGLRARWRAITSIAFGFAPVYLGLVGGQNSTLALLLYVLVYRAMYRGRERAAGAWAALGLFKPQLFLVLPLVFAASRRWRALGVYMLAATGLTACSLLVVGLDGGSAWVQVLFANNLEAGIAANQAFRMHSLKGFFDLLLPTHGQAALALSAAAALGLLVPLTRLWARAGSWSPAGLPSRFALTLLVGVLVDPHLFDYDLTVLVLAALLTGPIVPAARWWFLGVYLLLFLRVPLPVGGLNIQPSVPVLAAFTWWLWMRARSHAAVGNPALDAELPGQQVRPTARRPAAAPST